ncbi:MAG: helix-turn-helix domain-containing protein, partial [Planctomycetota bacterium]
DLEKLSQTIIQKIASSLHVEPSDMVGHCRQQSIVLARNIAIYLTRVLLNFSFQKIGKSFGNRDHSTVMHSYRKIKKMLSDNRTEFANTISMIKSVRQEITEMLAGPNGLGDLKDVQSQSD